MPEKLTDRAAADGVAKLDGWKLDGTAIIKRWRFKSFAPALRLANLVGYQAEARNHHPDLCVGWGYCEVRFTTHDVGGLTQADLDAAAALDALVKAAG